MTLNARSLEAQGRPPDLVKVIQLASGLCLVPFQVSRAAHCGRQRELVSAGKSQTQNSRHLTGHAVDLVVINQDGSANWQLHNYAHVNEDIQKVAKTLGIAVTWGGSWKTLVDGPHWELSRSHYPKT